MTVEIIIPKELSDYSQEIKSTLDKIPNFLCGQIIGIEKQSLGQGRGAAITGWKDKNKILYLDPTKLPEGRTLESAILHEVGHLAAESKQGLPLDMTDEWYHAQGWKLQSSKRGRWWESETPEKIYDIFGPREDFADAFDVFYRLPESLKAKSPEAFNFMQEHFGISEVAPKVASQPFTPETMWSLDEITQKVDKGNEIDEALTEWIQAEPGSLDELVRLVRNNDEYLDELHRVLKKQYGDKIVVYRGGSFGKGTVSVTTDKAIAVRFSKRLGKVAEVRQFSIDTDKVLAAGPTMENELIVNASDLKPITTQSSEEVLSEIVSNVVKGECYRDAWRFILKEDEGELVHGSWMGADGRTVKHAWVELPTGYVWEPQTKSFIAQDVFDKVFKPVVDARYTPEQAAVMAAREGYHGAWGETPLVEEVNDKSDTQGCPQKFVSRKGKTQSGTYPSASYLLE